MGVIFAVRHGQASFLAEDYDKLSPLGEEQARLLGAYWAGRGEAFDVIMSGPLKRQVDTAELVASAYRAAGRALPEVVVLDELMEFPAEDLARKHLPQLAASHEGVRESIRLFQESEHLPEKAAHFQRAYEVLLSHWANDGIDDPELETYPQFFDRVLRGFDHAAKAAREARVAVFTSGGPISMATQRALGIPIDKTMDLMWRLRNCSITEFETGEEGLALRTLNGVPHLADESLWTHR